MRCTKNEDTISVGDDNVRLRANERISAKNTASRVDFILVSPPLQPGRSAGQGRTGERQNCVKNLRHSDSYIPLLLLPAIFLRDSEDD